MRRGLWVLVVLGLCVTAVGEGLVEQKLFVNGEGDYKNYRIPALLTTEAGTLLAFCEGRESGDTGNIDMLLRRSEDGGETWSAPQVVWDAGSDVAGNPCPVQDRETGTIWLVMTWNDGADGERAIIEGTASKPRLPYTSYSKDDGKTWSKPVDISGMARDVTWGWYATGPGVGIQMTRGKYAGRLVIPANHSDVKYEGSYYQAHVLYSDDHGATWARSAPIGPGCNESQVVELTDGCKLEQLMELMGQEVKCM